MKREHIVIGAGASLLVLYLIYKATAEKFKSQYVPEGYDLVWHDEFDSPNIDKTKWYIYTGHHPNDHSCLTRANIYIQNNNLIIRSRAQNYTCKDLYDSGTYTSKWTSGFIRAIKTWKYGYFEIRAKLPTGKGVWPAYWMYNNAQKTQVDIFELFGDKPDKLVMHYSSKCAVPDTINCNVTPPGATCYTAGEFIHPNFSTAYHVYGFEWTPTFLRYTVDGVETMRIVGSNTIHLPKCPMILFLDTFVGGKPAIGDPDSTTKFPQYYFIDYVRVYQKNGG